MIIPFWSERAACVRPGVDPDWFHSSDPADIEAAKNVCGTCPIRDACRVYAETVINEDGLHRGDLWGVFGGTLPEERDVDLNLRRLLAAYTGGEPE